MSWSGKGCSLRNISLQLSKGSGKWRLRKDYLLAREAEVKHYEAEVEERRRSVLSFRKSAGRLSRHNAVNDIEWTQSRPSECGWRLLEALES